jgi:hypothetical protein
MAYTAEQLQELYRRCAVARERLQEQAVQALPRAKLLAAAHALNLPLDADMAQIGELELAFAYDLALYVGHPPAMQRFAAAQLHRQRDRVGQRVLLGLSAAWLSVFRVLGPHPVGGLLLEDALLGGEAWLLEDEFCEFSEPGTVLAARLARMRGFCITTGCVARLDEATLATLREALGDDPALLLEALEDARLVRSLWQRAVGMSVGRD